MNKLGLALAISLLLSACGGGGGSSSPSPTTPTTPTVTPNPTPNPTTNTNTSSSLNSTTTTAPKMNTSTNNSSNSNNSSAQTQPTSTARELHDISSIKSNMVATPSNEENALINAIIRETNAERAKFGLRPLTRDDTLTAYAEIRAQEYVKTKDYLDPHTRLNGSSALDIAYFDIEKASETGENLAYNDYNSTIDAQAKKVVQQWMNSKTGHRENILDEYVTKIGIGVYKKEGSSYYYYAQIFANDGTEAKSYLDNMGNNGISAEQIRTKINKVVSLDSGQKLVFSSNNSYDKNEDDDVLGNSYEVDLGNDREIVIRKPSLEGWKYQSIGVIEEKDEPIAYVNVGQSHIPSDVNSISGKYTGTLVGDINGGDRIRANVSADIKDRKMTLTTSDTHSIDPDVVVNLIAGDRYATDVKNLPELNFKQDLTWNPNSGQFEKSASEASTNHARFYGSDASEIGGQFSREVKANYGEDSNGNKNEYIGTYRGVYGAKKQ